MEKLIENLKARIGELESKKPGVYKLHDAALEELYSVYPFNKFEYVISHLIAENIISLNQYLNWVADKITRISTAHFASL